METGWRLISPDTPRKDTYCEMPHPFTFQVGPMVRLLFPPLSFCKEANPSLHARTGEHKQTMRPTIAANKAAYSQPDGPCPTLMLGDATDSNTTAGSERPRGSGTTLPQHLTCSRKPSYRSGLASTSALINNTPCSQELFTRNTQFLAITDTASRGRLLLQQLHASFTKADPPLLPAAHLPA